MKKRWISNLVAVGLVVSFLAGCASPQSGKPTTPGGDSAATATGGISNMSEKGEFPIAKEKVTLKVFYAPAAYITDMVDNEATKWLEEKTNVNIDWMLVSSDIGEKINLLLAANAEKNMPDVFLTDMGRTQVEKYGSDGVLIPLNDYLDKYSVNYKGDLFQANDKLERQMTAYDGNIYFLPKYYETTHLRHSQRLWINSKWLANVGMKTPTTTDEFYDVLKAFQKQDANGNGDPNDEIPYVCSTVACGGIDQFVMNAFVYSPDRVDKLYLEDGKITASYVQEGWREGLRFNKKLYAEGLLDSECFALTGEQMKALTSDPKGTRIGSVAADISPYFVDTTSPDVFDYEAVQPLKGPEGLQQSPLNLFDPSPFFTITSYCKTPEIAFRWADCMATDIAADLKNGNYEWMNLWYGTEGHPGAWEKAKDGEVGFSGEKAYYKQLFTWGDKLNNHWYENFLINMKGDWKPMGVFENTGDYNLEKVLYDSSVKADTVSADKTLPGLSLNPDEAEEVSQLSTDLQNYYRESMAKFVRGEMSLDTDWDAYLNEINSIGLPRLLALYQTAYDRAFQ